MSKLAWVSNLLTRLPHPLVLLCRAEDLGLADEDVAEGTTAAALLVEAGDGTHGEGLDHYGLGMGQTGLLGHHAAHITYVPAQAGGEAEVLVCLCPPLLPSLILAKSVQLLKLNAVFFSNFLLLLKSGVAPRPSSCL